LFFFGPNLGPVEVLPRCDVTTEERSHEIVSAVLDMCGVEVGDKRSQLERFVKGHLDEIERVAAEKAVAVYRTKTSEATDEVLSHTAIGAPTDAR
jgi:hypothetical protein